MTTTSQVKEKDDREESAGEYTVVVTPAMWSNSLVKMRRVHCFDHPGGRSDERGCIGTIDPGKAVLERTQVVG